MYLFKYYYKYLIQKNIYLSINSITYIRSSVLLLFCNCSYCINIYPNIRQILNMSWHKLTEIYKYIQKELLDL